MKLKTKARVLARINLILSLKACTGVLYIKAVLKRIEITKQLLITQLEEGNEEVYLSNDLSQAHLPLSFRFYDSIFNYIQDNISQEKKEFYSLKMAMAHQNEDTRSF